MNNKHKTFTFLLALLVLSSTVMPMAVVQYSTTYITTPVDSPRAVAATNLVVENRTINYDQLFNDDDFEFYVFNGTFEISQANVTLYNTTDSSKYASKLTVGDGSAIFYDVPQGVFEWNVTWSAAPGISLNGSMVSDGPEAYSSLKIGNLDWEDDDDDILVTVTDIDDAPGEGLNFTIYSRDSSTIYSQFILGTNGIANVTDIPIGNYTYYVTVASGIYTGTVLVAENFTTDGTTLLVHQTIGPFAGLPEYYDLEVFTYYETTLAPLEGALVNVTYKNGTELYYQYTPTNGTVRFLDLPVAYVNWTVSYLGSPIGLGSYSYNFTTVNTDLRAPAIESPGDKEVLVGTANITLTWNISDEYPAEFRFYVDDDLNTTVTWTNQTYFTFNATGYKIGVYELKLVATDLNDNTAEDIVSLRVYENVTPVLSGPEDLEFYYTLTGKILRWNITETNMDSFSLYEDGVSVANGSLNQEEPFYSYTISSILAIGVYNYTLWVNDTSGNWVTDEVTVTVLVDDMAPIFVYEPPTVSYAQGDQRIVRNWTVTDDFKDAYTISVDGGLIVSADWTSNTIVFDFAGLSAGTHEVVLVVTDIGGNTASSTVQVVVSISTASIMLLMVGALAGIVIIAGVLIWFVKYR
ncbi:MAG: hypothetical protein ACFFED_11060 [Candidatus Thorarchaeota archaeon]